MSLLWALITSVVTGHREVCQDGGTFCVARDNEGFYGDPRQDALAASGATAKCPIQFDCNGTSKNDLVAIQ